MLFFLIWVAQFIVIYVTSIAYWQREYAILADDPNYARPESDLLISVMAAFVFGIIPIGGVLIHYLFMADRYKHGWMIWPKFH